MHYLIAALAFFFLCIFVFLFWRYTSVSRGAEQRDQTLLIVLNPLIDRLRKKESVSTDEILAIARQPQYRPLLRQTLSHVGRLDLFPREYVSIAAEGEGLLAYWLMHPNEMGEAPKHIEFVEEVVRERDGSTGRFLVYRFRMGSGHRLENDGWLLGLAGPFVDADPPYSQTATAFSRFADQADKVKPADLVDWWIGVRY